MFHTFVPVGKVRISRVEKSCVQIECFNWLEIAIRIFQWFHFRDIIFGHSVITSVQIIQAFIIEEKPETTKMFVDLKNSYTTKLYSDRG